MRNFILAVLAVSAVAVSTVARADDFSGQQTNAEVTAYLDQQATSSQMADPTAPNSIRSHGRP